MKYFKKSFKKNLSSLRLMLHIDDLLFNLLTFNLNIYLQLPLKQQVQNNITIYTALYSIFFVQNLILKNGWRRASMQLIRLLGSISRHF
jgi:hypothetical protein